MFFPLKVLSKLQFARNTMAFKKLLPGILFFLFLLLLQSTVWSQTIAINEVMASNAWTIADEDGDFEDWIELFNYGSEPVNLEGFGLSDNYENPFKWVFPSVTLNPGEHLLVWASGKDRRPVQGAFTPGLVREVFGGIPGVAVSDLTGHISFPENPSTRNILTRLFEAPSNYGVEYGQRVYGYIKAPQSGFYTFWIASDDNSQLFISTSESPEDTLLIAHVPLNTAPRQWHLYPAQQSDPVHLQEGTYYYILALMKQNHWGDNLAVAWKLPDGTFEGPIEGQNIFRARAELHTNFSISQDGEEIILTSPQGDLISELLPRAIPTSISYGRVPDGTGDWHYFSEPTPGMPNNSQPYDELLSPPVFSQPGGFYSEAFHMSVSHPDPEVQIMFTLDGSDPDPENLSGTTYSYKNVYPQNPGDPFGIFLTNTFRTHLYSDSIFIYDRSAEPDKLTQISSTWHRTPYYLPNEPVSKGTVIRARAVKPGALPSETITATYFINESDTATYPVPVISLSLQEDAFFDYYEGIYVAGQLFDQWRTAYPHASPVGGTPSNYFLRGDFTEINAHLELFEPNRTVASLSQNMGLRLHGGWTRALPQKSLRLYARARYGASHFAHPFFPDRKYESFKRLILRNAGQDYHNAFMRDGVIQTMVSHLNFDTQNFQPAVLFLNGEYWGIHHIRERLDKYYLERVYGVDPENIDLLEANAITIEGDPEHYHSMIDFISNNSMNDPSNFEHIKTMMNLDNFTDYQISNIYFANTDWPGNNVKFWRLKTDGFQPHAPPGHDGRWRWLMYDTDYGLGLFETFSHNTLAFATDSTQTQWPNPAWSTFLLRKLLENETFRIDFINRFADLLNTAFLPERTTEIIEEYRQLLEPIMHEQTQRWSSPGWGNPTLWHNDVDDLILFASLRPIYQRNHIRMQFGLTDYTNLNVDVNDPAAGYIRINTIDIVAGTPGVPESPYPWSGTYFRNIPIQIEAIAKQGYVFSHWEGDNNGNDPLLNITPTGNHSLTAYFTESQAPETELIHYWHFNNLPDGTLTYVQPDFSEVTGALISYPGTGDGYMDKRTHRAEDPVSNLNLQMGQEPNQGAVLRTRNPSDTRSLIIDAPTTGYKDISLTYATTRTNNGATQQEVYYSTNDGAEWHYTGQSHTLSLLPDWDLISIDLNDFEDANNNADLQFKIVFAGDNTSGSSGNNRFDNVSVTGVLISSAAQPISNQNKITISPNPALNSFTLGLKKTGKPGGWLRIFSVDGTPVLEQAIVQTDTQIPIGHLKQGIYVIHFVNEQGDFSKKLIKM